MTTPLEQTPSTPSLGVRTESDGRKLNHAETALVKGTERALRRLGDLGYDKFARFEGVDGLDGVTPENMPPKYRVLLTEEAGRATHEANEVKFEEGEDVAERKQQALENLYATPWVESALRKKVVDWLCVDLDRQLIGYEEQIELIGLGRTVTLSKLASNISAANEAEELAAKFGEVPDREATRLRQQVSRLALSWLPTWYEKRD